MNTTLTNLEEHDKVQSQTLRLRMECISKQFGATKALDCVSLNVAAGEVLALVGENGAGKSTLMKILSGAQPADSGKMWLDGKPYAPGNPREARAAGVGMIYQELSLAPHLTVEQNICLGDEPIAAGGFLRARAMRTRAREALTMLNHDDIPPWTPLYRLSIAGQQLTEIARAVALGARVLVFDEPTGTLPQADVEKLFALIERLRNQGYAIVYISHFLEEVLRVASRYVVLRDGQIAGEGSTADITAETLADLMVGRRLGQMYHRSARQPGEVLLSLENLSGNDGKPRETTLELRRGEILGIAGLVGAGRTELLRTVFGLDPVRSGTVRVGVYQGQMDPCRSWDKGLGMVSEDRKAEGLAVNMSLADNLTLSKPAHTPAGRAKAAQQWIETLAVRCRSPRMAVGDLSGGNQQKIAIGRLLHHNVDVLLLDEPTRGIDVGSKSQIYQLIDELVSNTKASEHPARAVLLVSSSLQELLGMCDMIAVIHRGHLKTIRPSLEWTEHSLMLAISGTTDIA